MRGPSYTWSADTGETVYDGGFWHTPKDNVGANGECDNPRCGCHLYFAQKRGEPLDERWITR